MPYVLLILLIWQEMQIMKHLIIYFTTASYHFLLPRSKYSLQHSNVVLLMPEAKLHIHREQFAKLQFSIYLALQKPLRETEILKSIVAIISQV